MLAALGASVFMGRNLGVERYGIIELSNRVTTVFLIISLFGLPDIILKKIAIALLHKRITLIKNYMFTAISFSFSLALLIAMTIVVFAPAISSGIFDEPQLTLPLRLMIFAMIFHVLSRCFTSGVNGMGKIWQSNFGDQTLSMILILILLVIVNLFITIDVEVVAYIYLISRIGVALIMGGYWFKLVPLSQGLRSLTFQKDILKPSSHLLLSSASSLISMSASTVILGIMTSVREVGLYNISTRLALLTIIFMQISNTALAPKIASFYHLGKNNELQKLLSNVTLVLIIIGLSSLLIFVLWGRELLSLWGSDFKEAYSYLILLAIGQFVNVGTGAVSTILVMTGHEKIIGRISLTFMIISIFLNILFIHLFGGVGAALATGIIIASENFTRLIYVKSKTGINMFAFLKKN